MNKTMTEAGVVGYDTNYVPPEVRELVETLKNIIDQKDKEITALKARLLFLSENK